MKLIQRELPNGFFNLLFWNICFGYLPISIFMGILTLLNIIPVTFNGEKIYGVLGFILTLLSTPLVALIFTIPVWIFAKIGNFFLKILFK